MIPLVKVPFILITTYSVTASLTNPTPPITDKERRPDASRTTTFLRIWTRYAAYIRGPFWLAAMAEIAAILLAQLLQVTSSSAAECALGHLMPQGTVSDLRLTPLSTAGMLFIISGCWLRLKCFRTLKDLFTFEISIRKNHKLVTSGPYSYVRHPSYTGSMMVFIGLWFWFFSDGSWVRESGVLETVSGKTFIGVFTAIYVKLVVSLLQRMPEEDQLMKASFGKEWEQWASMVPYQLIPGVY